MTSVQVPPVDLAPGMPSRIVTISATDITEGGQSMAGKVVRFALSDTLDVTAGGDVIAKTQAEIVLDAQGNGSIRLPVYSEDVRTWCGDPDWAILVSAFGSQKAIRVPVGTSSIALSALPPVRPLRGREKQWAVTGAGITIVEGSQWGATVQLIGGVLAFTITVPPGATAWDKSGVFLTGSDHYQTLDPGVYFVHSGAIATSVGVPSVSLGWLAINTGRGGARRAEFTTVDYNGGTSATWKVATDQSGSWANSHWVRDEDGYHGTASSGTPYTGLPMGRHAVATGPTSLAIGIPSPRPGQLELHEGVGGKVAEYLPHRPSGAVEGYEYANSTGANGAWGDWRVRRQFGMRTAPIILTQASGDYTTNSARASWRLPFRVPRTVERIRVHVRAQNYRTGDNWGGMTIQGMAIGNHLGNGVMNGIQEIPDVAGGWIPRVTTQEWVSDWKTVFMTPGEYMFSYEANWTDAYPMKLVSGAAWGSEETGVYATGSASGYSRFSLQPLDIWIECEVPADVEVNYYTGTSVSMGQSSDYPVYMSYPQLHAYRHRAFCVMNAAGGWAIVDDSAQDPAVIGRFGAAGRSTKAYALWGGSNDIRARGATPAEIIAKIESWADTAMPLLGNPDLFLMTNGAGLSYTGPDDPDFVKLQEVNDWIRKEARLRPDVAGSIDVLSAMSIPGTVWKSDLAFVVGPNDAHPNTAGHKRYADLLDGTYYPEQVPATDTTGLLSAYLAARGE